MASRNKGQDTYYTYRMKIRPSEGHSKNLTVIIAALASSRLVFIYRLGSGNSGRCASWEVMTSADCTPHCVIVRPCRLGI